MIDTHAHLHLSDYATDRERVITRSFAMGISAIIEASIGEDSWQAVEDLSRSDPRIFATLGIHPHEANASAISAIGRLQARIRTTQPIAIGEAGIDLVRSRTRVEDQRLVFRAQVGLARETGLPLVIHCRDAFPEVLAIIDAEGRGQVKGVFHCFSGRREDALAVTGRGFAIGLAGGVTYDLNRWREILADVPPEALLLETDSPFLKPAPERHGRNEPAFVFETARAIARLLGRTAAQMEALADRNAARVFRLPLSAPGGSS